jgi:Protein of unknown function (DUF1064)
MPAPKKPVAPGNWNYWSAWVTASPLRTDSAAGKERAISYIADFCYEQRQPDGYWTQVVEDVKGMRTAVYELKRRLTFWRHRISVREV